MSTRHTWLLEVIMPDGKMVMMMMEIDYLWLVEKGVVGGTDLRLFDHWGTVFGDHLSGVSVLHTS